MKKMLFLLSILSLSFQIFSQNVFSVRGNQCFLNDKEFQVIGLRCSNALISEEAAEQLISQLDEYQRYGVNTISVYFMGSRYSDVNGYHTDARLKEEYKNRLGKILKACDERDMVVLVGVMYWGGTSKSPTNEYYAGWSQRDVNQAMRNTLLFLKENNYRNVFVDPDNEGMAHRTMNFNIDEMIREGKKLNTGIPIAWNLQGPPSSSADISIHFGNKTLNMPYIETEGTPDGYWGAYSKEKGVPHYINSGVYTEGKKAEQKRKTREHLDQGYGYMLASTWLQNVPPNYEPGGDGSPCDPGIRWWLEFVKEYLEKE